MHKSQLLVIVSLAWFFISNPVFSQEVDTVNVIDVLPVEINNGSENIEDSVKVLQENENLQPIENTSQINPETEEVELSELKLIIPDGDDWKITNENEAFDFKINAEGGNAANYLYSLNVSDESLDFTVNSDGQFRWTPDHSFVSSDQKTRSVNIVFEVHDTDGGVDKLGVDLIVRNVNRSPVVNDLPIFYINYKEKNTYFLMKDGKVFDPDNDLLSIQASMNSLPQGMRVSEKGEVSWKPSLSQFRKLRESPLLVNFKLKDQFGAETTGELMVEVSEQDLPPQITMIPNKDTVEIDEDETLNINFFVSDPNGVDDILTFSFVTDIKEIKPGSLTNLNISQYQFKWTPDFDFVREQNGTRVFEIDYFALDKENRRTSKIVTVKVKDKEDIRGKDLLAYSKYRTVLGMAWDLVEQLNGKEKQLKKDYKLAKKGKKNRAIFGAGLGLVTGLSPLISDPGASKVTAGIGGTATATLGTLEASDILGENPSEIMRQLSYVEQKRNEIIVNGNVFASKYSNRKDRRKSSFQNDMQNLSIRLNIKDATKLELDAGWDNPKSLTAKNITKAFKDYNVDKEFEKDL